MPFSALNANELDDHAAGDAIMQDTQNARPTLVDIHLWSGDATRRWYLPLIHEHPAFQALEHLAAPNAEIIAQRLLGIPFHVSLSDADQADIAACLASCR